MLASCTDAQGRGLQVVKVHVPAPMYRTSEEVKGLQVGQMCPTWLVDTNPPEACPSRCHSGGFTSWRQLCTGG